VHVLTTPNAQEFAAAAGAWLSRQPVENNLLLSHAFDPDSQPPGDGAQTFAWVVDQDDAIDADDAVVAAAWTMPPYRMTISEMPPAAAAALAEELCKREVPMPGVNGPAGTAAEFARCWSELTGKTGSRERDQWLMRCAAATRPTGMSGQPREARPDEVEQIGEWFSEMMRDSGLPPDKVRPHTTHMAQTQQASGRLIVWEEDGEPVGATGWMQPIAGVARPAGMFILPERRQGGYAGALLAEATARALDGGCDTCVCHHYLAYAPMQAVVERVGYRRVRDVTEYRFG
jgi:predicted GNAT family acetyltransferase